MVVWICSVYFLASCSIYITEFSDYIVDIQKQFPLLPLEETIVIVDIKTPL